MGGNPRSSGGSRRFFLGAAAMGCVASSAVSALAGEVFTAVSDGYHFGDVDAHGWIRAFPDSEGWFLLHAAGGDYLLDHLDDDFNVDTEGTDPIHLTGRADLIDHGITRCPDGGYLHISFSHTTTDTQYSFRYDSEWNLVASNILVTNDPQVHASDPPVLCSSLLNATGRGYGNLTSFQAVALDDDGAGIYLKNLQDPVSATGSAMLADPETDSILIVGFPWGFDYGLVMRRYDTSLDLLEGKSLDIPVPDGRRAMWSQGLMKVGDHYLVAYVVTTEQGGTSSDTGDIWLSAFDADWEPVETIPVIEEKEDYWAYMRPGLARKGSELVVTFDHQNGPLLAVVTLDLAALGEDPDDDTPWPAGVDESPAPADEDTPTAGVAEDDASGCACRAVSRGARGAGTWILLALPLAPAALRRWRA